MWSIKMYWRGGSTMPLMAMVFDGKTGIRRVAQFTTQEDAIEAMWALSMIITSSAYEGAEVVPTEIS